MATTRESLAEIAEVKKPVAEAGGPTWQVSFQAPQNLFGVKMSLDGFFHGKDKMDAVERFCDELKNVLIDGGNWTPWNAAAKAEDEESFSMRADTFSKLAKTDYRGKPGFQPKPKRR